LSEDYTNTLGAASKKYLDGNNILFTSKLNELSDKVKDLQTEVSRLLNTDLSKLFQELQKSFIDQSRKDLAVEMKKIEVKSVELQTTIDKLKNQVTRLEQIDLEKYFDKYQKTLSEIFGAVNSINLTLTVITQTQNSIVQSAGSIQNTIDAKHKELKQYFNTFNEVTTKHLTDQDDSALKNVQLLESKINSLAEQNNSIQKGLKTNRLFQYVIVGLLLIELFYLVLKHKKNI
jgi:activator of 2-hydroxyglutaryl-CoA dehydratase